MLRILRNSIKLQQMARYNHYDPASKGPAGNPAEQPCPDAYQLGNQFEHYPEHYGGFVHFDMDPYVRQASNLYDNWEYKYWGQWWQLGSTACNILWFLGPAMVFLVVSLDSMANEEKRTQGWRKQYEKAGFIPNQSSYFYRPRLDL